MIREGKEFTKCKNEQQFKMDFIRDAKKQLLLKRKSNVHLFCIETEETVLGFPDVMEVECSFENVSRFYEFKFSNEKGIIHFQPAQPSFYKMYPDMEITVIAYNKKSGKVHAFPVCELFEEKSNYKIDMGRVDLNKEEFHYESSGSES